MRERMRWDSVHSPTSLVDMVHAGWVQRLLRAEDWRGFPGPGDDRTGGQTRIEPQAKRIFEKLADLDISYVHEPANSIPGAQDVRPVDEVLSLRQATCLDMCVTYCCAALDAGIYPLILTLTRTSRKKELRHAIVLVPLERSWSTNCDVVIETGFSREPLIVDEDDFKNVVVDSPDDPSGTWLAIDVQQVSAPPGGATGKWNTALSKGADYVRNWEWDLCVDIGGLRSRRADDADLPTVMGVEGVLAPAYIPLPSNYTFLQLIRARYGVVSFHDRHELRNLRRWAMTPTVVVSEENASKNNAGAGRRPDVAVAVVTGVGGSGKTRLAAQLCHDLSSIGWYTGFLPTTTDITVGELSVLAELTTELLVVVDYAEEARRGQLATVFRALRDRRSPTRIVLTARGTDVWWDEFREELEQDGIDLSNALIISRLGEDRFQNDPVLFDRIYRKAVRSFAERMNHPSPRNIVVPDNLGATALDVVLRAWLAVYDESANSVKKLLTRDDLYDKVLTIEFTQWRKAPALAEVSRVHMGRAAATLSLLAPSQDEDEVDEVLSRLPEWASEHLRRSRFAELLVHTFLRVDGENSVILRPDPVAEYLILKIFGKKPGLLSQVLPVNLLEVSDFEDEDSDTDEITVQQHVRYRQAQNACMTITRAASLDPKKAYRLAKRTLRLRSHMWSNALDVAITQGGPFAPVLEEFIASGADLPLAEIEDAIPLGHGALRSAALALTRRLIDSTEQSPEQRALWVNTLAIRLSEAGEREEALKTAREATGLYRDLVEKSPATYKPGLAMSLTTLANHLSEAGERDEALEVAREAVHLRRDLVKVSPAAYTPDLAMSLSNLANRLLEVGERDEALEVAREAVHLRRDLVKVSPVHTQNLAGSLNNLANCLLEAGERDEALEVAREATDMYRDLVEKSPASYTSGLAMSLTTLANCLLEVGERDEALKAAREAVRLRQDSVQVSPTVYTPNLAESLITLANCLLEAGERDEALEIARKATELYRGLAKESPALYTPDLAVSLTTLANRLSEVGERDEALIVIRESTDLFRGLVEVSPATYTPDLAGSLSNLANCLAEVGRQDEALQVFIKGSDRFSPATRAHFLLTRAFWCNDNQEDDLVAAAREADDVDTPALLGPTRRVIVQAIADSGQNLEGLPSWATVEIGAEMRERLEKWINCDDDSERANILEEIWNSPSSSECSALSAVAELYVDVPPIGDLAGLVNRIAEEGVENVVLCIRRRHYAQVIVDDWYSAHANGQGCRSLCKHMVSRSSGENKDYPEWKRELDDPRMRVEVLQLLEMSFSEETANELRSILELADLSDPESAYEVHDSVEEAENALEDLLRVGNWRAMIAALRVRSDLGGLRYGSIAAVLGAAASDDLDRTCKLLDSMHQEIDEVDRQLVESLLKKALLAGDCPEGFEYLHEWFR